MQHLTVDRIIDFVSLTELDKEAVELSAAVNRHIRKCKQCFERVKAFQEIYDAFSTSEAYASMEKSIQDRKLTGQEIEKTFEAIDGDR